MVCGKNAGKHGICRTCTVPYARAWCVGERSGVLRQVIDSYKFYNNYAAHQVLASLLSERIGKLPGDCIIVPIPTVPAHIRQRGYDHMLLVAKKLAKAQGLPFATPLFRETTTKQRGQDRNERQVQASRAFGVNGGLRKDAIYVLVDDVVTTGATLHFAAKALFDAGAETVWAAAIARQPLD